jgi:MinD superfamily P-loop ATPase
MKEIVFISGKGGTGKTTLAAALAALWNDKIIADCDVDAADMHLLLQPVIRERKDFYSGIIPTIDKDTCIRCDECMDVCTFQAISDNYDIDSIKCEGCGVCYHFCPNQSIQLEERLCGEWYLSDTRFGPMVHARLGIAQENSGKLVTLIKNKARALASERGCHYVLIDGSPGIGCPVISSIGGAALVVIVVEPSLSGMHDMDRVIQLIKHFKIAGGVVINKFDLNPDLSTQIVHKIEQENMHFFGNIHYDPDVIRAMVQRKTVIEYSNNTISEEIRTIYGRIYAQTQKM